MAKRPSTIFDMRAGIEAPWEWGLQMKLAMLESVMSSLLKNLQCAF